MACLRLELLELLLERLQIAPGAAGNDRQVVGERRTPWRKASPKRRRRREAFDATSS
jgi:hypothetical protein